MPRKTNKKMRNPVKGDKYSQFSTTDPRDVLANKLKDLITKRPKNT
mgnify:CR=1 FL=1